LVSDWSSDGGSAYLALLGYLIGLVLLIPVSGFRANSDAARYSGRVLAVGGLATLGMTLRLLTLWTPAA